MAKISQIKLTWHPECLHFLLIIAETVYHLHWMLSQLNIHLVYPKNKQMGSVTVASFRNFNFRMPFLFLASLLCCYLVTTSFCLFCNLWTVAHQTSLSIGLPRQEYWSGLPFPYPGNLPNPGIKPTCLALQADSLPLSYLGSPTSEFFWASHF